MQEDNPRHRALSDRLDDELTGNRFYDRAIRPIIHGSYHAARFFGYQAQQSNDPEEWARSKDQFSKIGSGQAQTHYLSALRLRQLQRKWREFFGVFSK